jgi:hypothetical protein
VQGEKASLAKQGGGDMGRKDSVQMGSYHQVMAAFGSAESMLLLTSLTLFFKATCCCRLYDECFTAAF